MNSIDNLDNDQCDALKKALTYSDSPQEAEIKLAVQDKDINELFKSYCIENLGTPLRFDLFFD